MKRSKPLARTKGPTRAPRARARASAAEVLAWRQEVHRLCGGRCVQTGVPVPLNGSRWVWQCHHTIEKGAKAIGQLPAELALDPLLGIVLATSVHEHHTSRHERVPFEALPDHVIERAETLGDWAVRALVREHPPRDPAP